MAFRAELDRLMAPHTADIKDKVAHIRAAQFHSVDDLSVTLADDDTLYRIIMLPPSTARNKRAIEILQHEIMLSALVNVLKIDDIITTRNVWRLPLVYTKDMMAAPIRPDGENDPTQLMAPEVALEARQRLLRHYLARKKAANARNRAEDIARMLKQNQIIPAYRLYLHQRSGGPRFIMVRPRVPGRTLQDVITGGSWTAIRPALRALVATLDRLQMRYWLQHGNLAPNRVIITPDGRALLTDIDHMSIGAPEARADVVSPLGRYARGFDLRYLGACLAHMCARGTLPRELELLAAVWVAPTANMVQAALADGVPGGPGAFAPYEPSSISYRDYIITASRIAAALLGDPVHNGPTLEWTRPLMRDISPWTRALGASAWAAYALDDPSDVCWPENALHLDVLLD